MQWFEENNTGDRQKPAFCCTNAQETDMRKLLERCFHTVRRHVSKKFEKMWKEWPEPKINFLGNSTMDVKNKQR